MRTTRFAVVIALLLVVAAGMVRSYARGAAPSNWVIVARDPNYNIAIDSALIERGASRYGDTRFNTYLVWYRTDHAKPRLHDGQPFDRELVQSLVRCDSLWFKVVSDDMSMGDAIPIARQRTPANELWDQPWRRVELGTSEEMAAQAACFYARRKR